jgi:hypothetical protein
MWLRHLEVEKVRWRVELGENLSRVLLHSRVVSNSVISSEEGITGWNSDVDVESYNRAEF